VRFWDSSALAPLLVREADSGLRLEQLQSDPVVVVWYGTLAEIESALCRRKREGTLTRGGESEARGRLRAFADGWAEVRPTEAVRVRAIRLLRVHPVRAAEAFQLAAALESCEGRPEGFGFLTGDLRLRAAAEAEGFDAG
jgi:predicted nucleic acid-binding protein